MSKRSIIALICFIFLITGNISVNSEDMVDSIISARSGVLMEAGTGKILYEFNMNEKLPLASVTKTMTMLLISESIHSGKIKFDDMVTVSETAASMGGSQIWLEVGEQMSVRDMLKAIAVASANDASVAMAEHLYGSEEKFAEEMNKKAKDIGAVSTHFDNASGLEEENNYSTAHDVALISKELLKYDEIREFLTIWMDSLRNGEFALSNTNRLIRHYNGATGIKTGSTSTAKYCLSASAKRDDLELIAVILGAPTTNDRFGSASKLLDYGFANFAIVKDDVAINDIPVTGGVKDILKVGVPEGISVVVEKSKQESVETDIKISDEVKAPIRQGQKVGEVVFRIDKEIIQKTDICALEDIERINVWEMFLKMLGIWLKP